VIETFRFIIFDEKGHNRKEDHGGLYFEVFTCPKKNYKEDVVVFFLLLIPFVNYRNLKTY